MPYSQCPACATAPMEVFHEVAGVPVNSCILMDSPQEARDYPRGDIALGFCPACGFIVNTAFDPKLTEYSGRYEETQAFSGTFNRFHRELAQRLIDRYDLHGKKVLEIGCGKGEFLVLLSEMGDNEGLGFDPGYHEERLSSEAAERLTFIRDFYSEKYSGHKADFVCCKMTLEHIPDVAEFVGTVRRAIGDAPETIVFFQIPEATRIIRDCAFEDIYYEHCSYFTPGSLARLFRRSGFQVMDLEIEYAGQYLTIEARPDGGGGEEPILDAEDDLEQMRRYVAEFPGRFQEVTERWRQRLEQIREAGERAVLWGSGSKAVAFLTTLDPGGQIERVVDINPYRQGHFMPGTGQEILSPDALADYRPDVVIVMNPIYEEEITADLRARGLTPRIYTL